MRTLVAYYSLVGSTKCVAEAIADEMEADVERLLPKEKMDAERFMTYYWGGNRKHPEEKVEIRPLDHDPNDYDMIVIGTPVWAWGPAPPIYSFIVDYHFKGKKVALFACSEGERGKTFEKMEYLLEGNRIISKQEFVNPGKDKDGSCSQKARDWARNLVKSSKRNVKSSGS